MRYIYVGGHVVPKHCIYGPRPAEGIVLNDLEWWSVNDHFYKAQREKDIASTQRANEEAKKNFSYQMTKNWNNTLASVKTLGEQRRIEKARKQKQDKIDQYNEILKKREEEKKEILASVRKILYESKDSAKAIDQAVLLSTVLDGRQKQIEMKNKLRDELREKDRLYAEKIFKDVEDFKKEQKMEEIKERKKKETQRQMLNEQVADIKRRREEEEEDSVAEEIKDMKNMEIENEKIHHCNVVEMNYRKEFARMFTKKTQNQLEFERNVKLENDEEDEINKIFIKYADRMRNERKEREEKMLQESIERRMKIAEELAKKIRQREEKESERQSAMENELEANLEAEEEKKRLERERLRNEIVEAKRKAEEDAAHERHVRLQEKKWEMIQLTKTMEVNQKWREDMKRKAREEALKRNADLDEQCKANAERRAKDLLEWETPLEDLTKDTEEENRYGEEALEFVRQYKLPEKPVLDAIVKLKKLNGTYPAETKAKEQTNECPERKHPRVQLKNGYCLKD